MYSPNLKKLLLKLPKGLQTLTIENKKRLLLLKADAPKHAAIKFCSATPDIVAEVTDAWSNYIPEKTEEDGYPHFVMSLIWFKEQAVTHGAGLRQRPEGARLLVYRDSLAEV
ncbi:hypothetical protein VE02_09907 [Pseudogymnoascus sp. 03VT05]|nr:hypothetical protein VE02_09907 [Pseudogymnoascus sp. 03VT05]